MLSPLYPDFPKACIKRKGGITPGIIFLGSCRCRELAKAKAEVFLLRAQHSLSSFPELLVLVWSDVEKGSVQWQLVSQESLCTRTCFQETVENQPLRSRSVNLSLRRAWFWVSFRLARIVEEKIKEQMLSWLAHCSHHSHLDEYIQSNSKDAPGKRQELGHCC